MNDFIKIRKDLDEQAQKKIKTLLKKYKTGQDDLIEEIAAVILKNQDDSGFVVYSPSMVAEIKKDIKNNLDSLSKSENDFLEKLLEDAASDAIKETALKIGMVADWHILRDEFVKRAINTPIDGKNFSSRIWENTNDLANRIYNDVLDCIRNGTRPNAIARKIKDDYGATAYQAKRLVNTELARVVSDAQLDVYKNSGVVQKVMWMATLEDNTCENCAGLDGKTFDIDKAPRQPLHPCCRCCYVPVVDGHTPAKRADNETKKNIDYVTYSEWETNKGGAK